MTPQNQGRQFEKDLSEEFGLKQTPASGSVWHDKLDLVGDDTRWSLKYTESGAFPLTSSDIYEAEQVCFGPGGDGRTPIWAIRFPPGDFIVLRKNDFKLMQAGYTKLLNIIEEDRPQVKARKDRASRPELLREE